MRAEGSRWEKMWSAFGVAAELGRNDADAYLGAVCHGDPALREEIENLLVVKQDTSALLETPSFAAQERAADDPAGLIGTKIGPYLITDVLGAGGMGVVYAAWQGEPLNRKVAMKLVKAGMDSREVLGRFKIESELLAVMQHGNVAQIFDAGSDDHGRAYFVMEYVDGVPITRFCQQHRCTIGQRIDLFLQVCRGVEHAHQHGIIHRDIKPGNVLVRGQGGDCQAKIIDFGIAKVFGDSTRASPHTAHGIRVGTPQYMSPEQAATDRIGVDTRSDIYSLGALLYRMLSGSHPLDGVLQAAVSGDELHRLITELPLVPPSKRARREAPDGAFLAAIGETAESLSSRLHGELDWIIAKAMAAECEHRYSSISELIHELHRFLNHEPVHAGPPGRVYRLRKFVRRHRLGVLAGAAVTATLLLGIVVSTTLAVEAKRQQALAEAARNNALTSAQRSENILNFLSEMLIEGNPWARKPGNSNQGPLTVSALLDAASTRLDRFENDPVVLDELRSVLIRTYIGLGETTRALDLYDRSYAQDGLPEAIRKRQLQQQGHYILMHIRAGRYKEAEELGKRLFASSEKLLGRTDRLTIRLQRATANALLFLNRNDEALALLQDNLARARQLSESSAETFEARQLLGYLHSVAGRWEQAQAMQSAALRDSIVLNGENHLKTLRLIATQADSLYRQGKLTQAVDVYYEVIERMKTHIGPEHAQVYRAMSNLGLILNGLGRYQDAVQVLEGVLTHRRKTLGAKHLNTLNTMDNLAEAYQALGRYGEALSLRRDVYQGRLASLGPSHPKTLGALADLGRSDLATGKPLAAVGKLRKAWTGLIKASGTEARSTLGTALGLGRALTEAGEFDQAIALFEQIQPLLKARFPRDHWVHHQMASLYGHALSDAGRYQQAEPLLVSAHAGLLKRFGAKDWRTLLASEHLQAYYRATGRSGEAAQLQRRL